MGRAINNEKDIDTLKMEMTQVRDAIAEVFESIDQFDTEANQRVYPLKKHIIKVKGVDYDGKTIKKLIGRPIERDLT